jgi:hypothetical protein
MRARLQAAPDNIECSKCSAAQDTGLGPGYISSVLQDAMRQPWCAFKNAAPGFTQAFRVLYTALMSLASEAVMTSPDKIP